MAHHVPWGGLQCYGSCKTDEQLLFDSAHYTHSFSRWRGLFVPLHLQQCCKIIMLLGYYLEQGEILQWFTLRIDSVNNHCSGKDWKWVRTDGVTFKMEVSTSTVSLFPTVLGRSAVAFCPQSWYGWLGVGCTAKLGSHSLWKLKLSTVDYPGAWKLRGILEERSWTSAAGMPFCLLWLRPGYTLSGGTHGYGTGLLFQHTLNANGGSLKPKIYTTTFLLTCPGYLLWPLM